MLHIKSYLSILDEITRVLQDYGVLPDETDPGYAAAAAIYETAFRELMRYGIKHEYHNGAVRICTDGKTYAMRMGTRETEAAGGRGMDITPNWTKPKMVSGNTRSGKEVVRTPSAKAAEHAGVEVFEEGEEEEYPDTSIFVEEGSTVLTKQPESVPSAEQDAHDTENDASENCRENAADGDDEIPEGYYGMDETVKVEPAPDNSFKEKAKDVPPEASTEYINGDLVEEYSEDQEDGDEMQREPVDIDRDDDDGINLAEGPGESEPSEVGDDQEPAAGDAKEDAAAEEFNAGVMEGIETEYHKAPPVKMPSFMHKDDFTFNYANLLIKGKDGMDATAQVIIAPLSINDADPRMLLCIIQDGKSETVLTGGNRELISIGGYRVVVQGWMDGDKFKSSCTLKKNYIEDGVRLEAETREFGKKGHILLDDDDENIQIHIVPATFNNDENGNADYIYCVFSNGVETTGDTSAGNRAEIDFRDKRYRIACAWKDNTLYAHTEEIEEIAG